MSEDRRQMKTGEQGSFLRPPETIDQQPVANNIILI
jgi:hypothetical protein